MVVIAPETLTADMLAALHRAALYRALARGFSHPRATDWEAFIAPWRDLEQAGLDWPFSAPELIAAACRQLNAAGQEATDNETFRLFGPAAAATPHETAYGDPGRLMAKAAHLADIAGFYRAFGLAPRSGGETNLEDHLTMELEFMSQLNAKEALALDEGWDDHLATTREAQQSFLRDHLGI